jgi:hypothetical protein
LTLVAIAGDAAIDDLRIESPNRRVVEPEALDDAGAEILDDDIGALQKLPQYGEVLRILEVDRKTFLVAIDGMENRGVAPYFGVAEIEAARKVAAIRTLDLDDARAEIHEPQRGVRP